ncbi:phosphatidylserine decarboxylase family protein [Sinomicrobium soli]|uniref:phosphatidylserine decarboxylase family protein n=1 Tax=Sinomicrobium sp. N-1-3-6 TaxID=2219864 RepID=UPI000DCE8587|nr:phosphatidylserine decarboxylase family protein [Sinomicrobium sp. N-1-3-6]RAV28382.1 phosphatidylserine decarboxylase family protein [Sinomicrobium sp. N-1-3-6]
MFHKEGHRIILAAFFLTVLVVLGAEHLIPVKWLGILLQTAAIITFVLILQFFRNPKRKTLLNEQHIIAPVDGKVVVIEEVMEKEYFNEKRLQVSIFMSPVNVHVTRYALGGEVVYSKYHPGKYLVAWHPKSSEDNERTSVVVKNPVWGEVMYKQIAGALARRIVNYAKPGDIAVQGSDAGFIKFGSRVDLLLPPDASIKVRLNQHVKGGIDIIAEK